MAAPANKTIADLNGKWMLNKTLSTDTDKALALQGIGFFIRKSIGLATIYVDINQYDGPPTPPNTSTENVVHIDSLQSASKLTSTQENRCVDGESRPHGDWLFGNCKAFSKLVTEEDVKTWVVEKHGAFMGEGWLTGPEEATGPNGALHLYNSVENVDPKGGWTAAQIWGFQTIDGERRYVRHVVVEKGGQVETIKMVYDFIP
ncbi:uncharacterized protein B0I36DRAFT_326949 [Microdochium trichocladiopsis]|uniref:Uncharacterized protein n=1 Tax=Microdochium trichocladiopsis TaxID=1682393 RepID=A0A9P8Y1W2_9PEZI|nr:uncharacterized protein B0I36DRAFT_326949 [Microdochium trichocladiopsis]KAH7027363.1 hypothetical protein B0I36DRAFT_326949 [Microdochium trichocladiopsis]